MTSDDDAGPDRRDLPRPHAGLRSHDEPGGDGQARRQHPHGRLDHGGSFNGNVLGTACGKVAVEQLTPDRIDGMDRRAGQLRATLVRPAAAVG